MLGFIIGIFAVGVLGTFIMALMKSSGEADRKIIAGGNKNA